MGKIRTLARARRHQHTLCDCRQDQLPARQTILPRAQKSVNRLSRYVGTDDVSWLETFEKAASDELAVYRYAPKFGYRHRKVNHGKGEYVRGDIHTNSIEGLWSQVKRSIGGTHHSVSWKYLQNYINEFSFRYNHRKDASLFASMVSRVPSTLSQAA